MSALNLLRIRAVILEILEQHLEAIDIETKEVDGSFDWFTSGVLDSLDFVTLLTTVEETLGQQLDLTELDFDNLETPDALADQLHRLVNS